MSEARTKDEARTRVDRVLRVLLPIAVLALGVVVWELVVRVGDIPPYVLPSPRLVFSTLISDWAVLGASLLVTLTTTLEGFCSRPPAASGLPCCSTSRASSNIRSIPTRSFCR
jgi:NitT/TauT family transport system permease protein